jgi:hypothetical protein
LAPNAVKREILCARCRSLRPTCYVIVQSYSIAEENSTKFSSKFPLACFIKIVFHLLCQRTLIHQQKRKNDKQRKEKVSAPNNQDSARR